MLAILSHNCFFFGFIIGYFRRPSVPSTICFKVLLYFKVFPYDGHNESKFLHGKNRRVPSVYVSFD